METFLAILMVVGIYVVIPAVIGFAILGGVIVAARRQRAKARLAEQIEAEFEAKPEAEPSREAPVPVQAERRR